MITNEQIETFQRDGAVMIKNAMTDWVDVMRAGVARNMEHPSKYASENDVFEGQGRFFDDYCNWLRIPEFAQVVRKSPAAQLRPGRCDQHPPNFSMITSLLKRVKPQSQRRGIRMGHIILLRAPKL